MRGLQPPLLLVKILDKAVEQIKGYIESLLAEEKEIFLVDMIQKGVGNTAKLIVLLDGDNGVTIDQCASISRQTSHFIDEESELSEPLTLEVSSAGLDHPLKLTRQYFKNIGKNVRVTLNDGKVIEGTLAEVSEEMIKVDVLVNPKKKTTEQETINFEEINKTIVLVSFK